MEPPIDEPPTAPVAEELVEADDEVLLVVGDVAALDVRPEVVEPPQPAAFAAPAQTCTHASCTNTSSISRDQLYIHDEMFISYK